MPAPLEDGNVDFLGGQDASDAPDRIAPNAYHAGININIGEGAGDKPRRVGPRWGVRTIDPSFPEGGIKLPTGSTRSYKNIYGSGKFQARIDYSIGTEYFQLIIISGVIFLVNQNTLETQVLELGDETTLDETADRFNWSEAGRFLVIFDWPSYPVIIEGVTARRADPAKYEVPISVLGTYNNNRLQIANAGNEFTGGDPSGNTVTPDAPVTFEEVLLNSAPYVAQVFQLGTNYGNDPITAMASLQAADTGTGIGALLVSTRKSIFSYQTQLPRSEWENVQFGQLFLDKCGIASQQSFVNVNSDIHFVSSDGQVRSASMSREEQRRWSRTPYSREVKNWMVYHDKDLIPFSVIGYFQNKIFVSVNPYRVTAQSQKGDTVTDYASGGMVVLEMESDSQLGQVAQPVWTGLWTGVRPMSMGENGGRFFIMSKDDGGINQLYELDPTLTYDMIHDIRRDINSRIYTREYIFQNKFVNKSFTDLELLISEVQGNLKIEIDYRPSHAKRFIKYGSFYHDAPWFTSQVPGDHEIVGFAPHGFKSLTFGDPVDEQSCNPVTKDNYNDFKKVQLRVDIQAKDWSLDGLRLQAMPSGTSEKITACKKYGVVEDFFDQFNDDWVIPHVQRS